MQRRRRFNVAAHRIALSGVAALAAGCVRLDKSDSLPVATPRATVAALQALSGPDAQLRVLPVTVDGRPIAAYYIAHPGSRGVLIECGGSGNEVVAPIKVLEPRTRANGLDLVVFSYYQQGERMPTIAQARAEAQAVYAAVAAVRPPASQRVFLLGYSLGGWFALDLAATQPAAGLMLVGAGTTPAAIIRRTYAPWSALVAIRPDRDEQQLNAALYTPRIRVPTLLVTSTGDQDVPMSIGQDLFATLPVATPKRLVVLQGVAHGRYLLSGDLWHDAGDFFGWRTASSAP